MGNCFVLIKVCNENSGAGSALGKCKKITLKTDERVKEFTAATMVVKNMLTKYSSSGVGSWSENPKPSRHDLPLSSQFKLGNSKTYNNLLPAASCPTSLTISAGCTDEMMKAGGGVKRIKVVIRKQELHELLSKQQQVPLPLIIGEVLSLSSCTRNDSTYWKPKLVSIPEDNEL